MNYKRAVGECYFSFQSYGVKLRVGMKNLTRIEELKSRIREILPYGVELIEPSDAEHFLDVMEHPGTFEIYKDKVMVASGADDGENFFNALNSQIRLTTAEYAVGKVFLHAGAVAWKNHALIIPASSFSGKSALVHALVKQGATYYSDEYAVIDEDGLLYPFPKTLSLRGIANDFEQVERTVESIGGIVGERPLPIGFVLICKYEKGVKNQREFEPELLSAGQGTLEMFAHSIPARFNPNFTLETLCKIAGRAIIAKCQRGEADSFATLLLDYWDAANQN